MRLRLLMGISAIAMLSATVANAQDVVMRRPLPSVTTEQGVTTPTPTPTSPTGTPSPTPTPASTFDAHVYAAQLSCDQPTSKYIFSCFDVSGLQEDGSFSSKVNDPNGQDCAGQPLDASWQLIGNAFGLVPPPQVPAAMAKAGTTCDPSQNQKSTVTGAQCQTDGPPICQAITYEYQPYSFDGGFIGFSQVDSVQNVDLSQCQASQDLTYTDKIFLSQSGMLPPSPSIVSQCSTPSLYGANGSCSTKTTYDPGWPETGKIHVDTRFDDQCYALYNVTSPFDSEQMVASSVDPGLCQAQHPTAEQKAILAETSPQFVDYQTEDRSCPEDAFIDANYQRYNLYLADGTGSDPETALASGNPYESSYGAYLRSIFDNAIRGSAVDGTISRGNSPYEVELDDNTSPPPNTNTYCAGAPQAKTYDLGSVTVVFEIPYVCTDQSPNSYFQTWNNVDDASTFPMTAGNCQSMHADDVNAMTRYMDGWVAETSGEDGDNIGNVSVTDEPDRQVIRVKWTQEMFFSNDFLQC